MITLSYGSISSLHEHPHYWLNKQAGIKMPEWDFFKKGREGHRIIQDHVSGIKKDKRLKFFKEKFPLVEECDFDPKMNFRIKINDKYEVQGFFDGLNEDTETTLEIKTGTPWTLSKFQNSYQRKIYSLLRPDIKNQIIITADSNPDNWEINRPKYFQISPTKTDRKEALEYILEGIKILESGDFHRDLEKQADGSFKCVDFRCLYGNNCLFK